MNPSPGHDLLKGGILMSIGFFLMAVFGALLKVAAAHSSFIFAVWLTFSTAFVIQLVIVLPSGLKFFKTHHIIKHFFRGFFGVAATMCYVVALAHLKLMNATLLFNTAPLFVPILASIFLRQHLSWKIWLAIFIGFVGITLIIRPTSQIIESPWNLIAFASGILLAIAFFYVKLLSVTDPMMRVSLYFFFFGSVLLIPFLPFIWENYTYAAWLWGIGTGVASIIAQLFIIKAYQVADAGPVGVFQYISVVSAGVIDWVVWGKLPTTLTVIGTVLVIASAITVILISLPKRKKS